MRKNITIRDIAVKASVSPSTVSKVLSGRNAEAISDVVKARIRRISKQLRYKPNYGAKLINRMRTGTVAILMAEAGLCEEHVRGLVLELTVMLNQRGYSQYITPLTRKNALHAVEDLVDRGCEAFILLGTPYHYRGIQRIIEDNQCTYIAFSSLYPRNIQHDTAQGVAELIRFFQKRDCSDFRVLMPGWRDGIGRYNTRFEGLKQVFPHSPDRELLKRFVVLFRDSGPPVKHREFFRHYFNIGYRQTRKLLSGRGGKPDAILYYQDFMAMGGLRWLHENRGRVGKEILVAGVNDIFAAEFNPMPFSSVGLDLPGIVSALGDNMLGQGELLVKIAPKVYLRDMAGYC